MLGTAAGFVKPDRENYTIQVTDEPARAIIRMKAEGEKVARIARTVSLSRLTIYRVLQHHEEGPLAV